MRVAERTDGELVQCVRMKVRFKRIDHRVSGSRGPLWEDAIPLSQSQVSGL